MTIDVREALIAENAELAALVATADHSTEIPTCPGWDLTKLLRHVGRGHRWAATMVRERATEVLDPRQVPGGKPPADREGIVGWLTQSAQEVLDAVDETGADVPVWTFTGPQPAAWWIRRRLHEETGHRADALIGLGEPVDLAPELGADGLSEWLDLLVARRTALLAPDATMHLHATDVPGEWVVRASGDGIAWEPGHEKATVALRGPASQLYLALLRRVPLDDVEVLGDAAVARSFLDGSPF